MPYSDYRPDLMGTATLEPSGSFEAGSLQSFTLVYTAGAFGIDDTGSIKIGFRFATDFGPVQFTDPKAPGLHHGRGLQRRHAGGQVGVQAQHPPLEPLALHRRGEGLPGARRHHHHPLRRPPAGLARHPPADLLRERIRVPRAGRPDRHLRLRGAAGEPEDRHRAGTGRALARGAADAGARGRAVPAVDQGRRQVGQSVRSRRSHAAAARPTAPVAGPAGRRCASRRAAFAAVVEGFECARARRRHHPRARRERARSCAAAIRCAWPPRTRRSCTSGATRTASPTRRSAPTRRASISSSAATRPSST